MLRKLDIDALKKRRNTLMSDSQIGEPTDWGHYGGLIRLAARSWILPYL
jgi:catalase (peroxidase I)